MLVLLTRSKSIKKEVRGILKKPIVTKMFSRQEKLRSEYVENYGETWKTAKKTDHRAHRAVPGCGPQPPAVERPATEMEPIRCTGTYGGGWSARSRAKDRNCTAVARDVLTSWNHCLVCVLLHASILDVAILPAVRKPSRKILLILKINQLSVWIRCDMLLKEMKVVQLLLANLLLHEFFYIRKLL